MVKYQLTQAYLFSKFIAIMNVKSWLQATKQCMADRQKVVDELSTSINYIHQLSSGHKVPSVRYSQRLAAASRKHTPYAVMTKEALLPEVWGDDEEAAA